MKSLEDQITSIKNIFDRIKNAIKAKGVEVSDCDSPEVYADKIGDIELDAGAALNIMAFKSNTGIPEKPVGGTWIWEENKIVYPTGWSNGSGLTGEVYMSQAIFRKDGKILQNWTDPIRITGPMGLPGRDGLPGEKGEAGDVQIAERYVFIYKSSENKPDLPVGGSWSIETDEITPPLGWSLTSELSYPIWVSTGRFLRTAPTNAVWSDPIRLSGNDGKDGVDGISEEFIYKLTKTSLQIPAQPESPNIDNFIPNNWTDHPSGISPENQVEWVCVRQKKGGKWGIFSSPAIWSKWGVNGKSGDGIEYIYFASKTGVNPTIDYPEDNSIFQRDGYVPTGWTSTPRGVSIKSPYEFVSSRKGSAGNWSVFSEPVLWAKYGETGESGISIREMYASSETAPAVEKTEINPGSIWGIKIPSGTEKPIWAISAYVKYNGELATTEEYPGIQYGWSDPYIKTGRNGKDGVPTDYITTVFAESISTPNAPALNVDPASPGTSTNESGETITWKTLPDTISQSWWRCSGKVSGVTGLVFEWGSPVKDSGRDGAAKDGKHEEFRYAISENLLISPEINKTERIPSGWITTNDPGYADLVNNVKTGKFLFWTKATISADNKLDGEWSEPAPLNGPQGEIGPVGPAGSVGPQGISGIPGVSFEVSYTIGSKDNYDNNLWSDSIESLVTTEEMPYIWAKQGKRTYTSSDDVGTVTWDAPFKLSGTNGLNGETGKSGQIIYPAGIYDKTKTYRTDNFKAPYVWDTASGKFYVLNDSEWIAGQDVPISESSSWVAFDTLEAIYAKIAVIPNALIGSAVYNGDYMFSQQGTGTSPNYADFKITEANLWESSGNIEELRTFKPNALINFKTGSAYFGKGAFSFSADGKAEFRINYPDETNPAMILSSEHPGIVQYWPNGQIQKQEVWEYDSSGKPKSIITKYYDESGTMVATVDALGQWQKVSGGWDTAYVRFEHMNEPSIDDWATVITDPTIVGGFIPSNLPKKILYYYKRSGDPGEFDGLKYEGPKEMTDPAPTSITGTYSGVTYYSGSLLDSKARYCKVENMQYAINFTFEHAVKVVKESTSWKATYVNSDNIEPINIMNFDQSIGEFTYQSILQQPSFQLIKMRYLFDRYVDGKIDNATAGQPSQIMYIVKVYQSKRTIYTEAESLSEIENNAVYYFVLNESDLPNEVRTASDEITLDNSWFNKFSWEN